MTSRSKVELFAAIRRDARAGLSGRAIERKYRVGWRTVRQAMTSAWPAERKVYPSRGSRLDPYRPVIDEILRWIWTRRENSGIPRKGSSAGCSTSMA